MSSISIIIPVLNEAENILKLLQHINLRATTNSIKEIIVVDGGSNDGTKTIISDAMSGRTVLSSVDERSLSRSRISTTLRAASATTLEMTPITLLTSNKGRARQMNLGAKHAKGSILYFLHADSFPPNSFDQSILQEIENGNQAGCFKMKFDSNHWWLQLAGWFTKFNWKACRGGDQSLFITKKLFDDLNGFDEKFTIYEDIDLINKLYTKNQFVVIQKPITTSARRYRQKGIAKLQVHFWMIYLKKFFGASADNLYQYYNKYVA